MKELLFVLLVSFGLMGTANASTTITIGNLGTVHIERTLDLPDGGNVRFDPKPEAHTANWSFPVHWKTENGSGDFQLSGDDSVSMTDIVNFLIDLFF